MGTIAMIWVASIGTLFPIQLNTISSISSFSLLKPAPLIAKNISQVALAFSKVNPQKIFNKYSVKLTHSSFNEWTIWVNNNQIIKIKNPLEAGLITARINYLLKLPDFDPSQIAPLQKDGRDMVQIGKEVVKIPGKLDSSGANLIELVNNLRIATGVKPLNLFEVQGKVYEVATTQNGINGFASWYGPYFHGRMTANGEIFNENEMTAAHKSLPFNTLLQVTNLSNGKTAIVRINDRGPYVGDRVLDLSKAAALEIGSESSGVVPIKATILAKN
jgi:rare lipoprotein A